MRKLLLFFILITSQLFYSQSDCVSAIPVCGNSGISYTPSGPGSIIEDLGGCLIDDENFSVWYTFTAATSGTLAFTIDANVNSTDYDFAVYGPNANCASLGPPIRCNFASTSPSGNTGLELIDTNSVYFEQYLDVIAGETYYLVIDNYSNSLNGFSLNWEGTATLTSPFTNPVLTPNPFITPGVPAANPVNPNEILKCALPMMFDFTTLSTGILNGNVNFTITYHDNVNDAITGNSPITTATVNGTTVYYYRLEYNDPTNPNSAINGCFITGKFKFKQGNIVALDATITACNINGFGTGLFNLTTANVFGDPTAIKKYYPTLADLNAGTNEITNPASFTSTAPRVIFVKVTSLEGCTDIAEITLQFLPPLPVNNVTLTTCNIGNFGTGIFDLTSANVYTGTNITKKFYLSLTDLTSGTNEITNPAAYSSTAPKIIYVKVINSDGCTGNGQITLQFFPPLPVGNASILGCNNNNLESGVFDLSTANVYTGTNLTKKYYLSLADLTAGINEIPNPTAYTSTVPKKIYVKVINASGCAGNGEITLQFYPVAIVYTAKLEACFIVTNINTGLFNLTTANVTAQPFTLKLYYTTLANANAGTNPIVNPSAYIATTGEAFIKVFNSNGCYSVARVELKVLPPVKSTVLADKTICIEDRTTLDAGPGFDGYEWSTGATTQAIQGVAVGAYWVKLKTGNCFTLQTVNVFASAQPVIASLDITNNTITVNASGGTAPYEYSINGTTWQTSNIFTNLPRGENKIYVRDSYNCNPVPVQVTVPNLVNAITPNGDNVNDGVDYSALAYKKNLVFTVYNRYGNKIYEADKMQNYKWNGTSGGKKIETGTYWYTITWTENDIAATQTKYSGWILVKNRE